ncbi:hypothetical protein Hanom_Chr09g00759531 [Helianthus anomalus]
MMVNHIHALNSSETNSSISLSELPPSSTAALANSLHFAAFFRVTTPLSSSIIFIIHDTRFSLVTIPFSLALTLTPTSQISSSNLAFVI